MKFKVILLLSLFFTEKVLVSLDYPGDGTNRHVNVFINTKLETGDTVGTTNPGLCYFVGVNGLRLDAAGSGSIPFRTPISIEASIELSQNIILDLDSDITLAGRVSLNSSGYIKGGSNRIILTGPFYLQNYWISADGGSIRFSGNGNSIFFNEGGSLRQSDSSYDLEFRSTILNGVKQGSIPASGDLILYDSIIKLDSDYCFNSSGVLQVYDDVLITGTHTFCLDAPCEIYDNAKLMFDIGTTFSMGTHGSITIADNHTGMIHFNGSSVLIGTTDFNVDYGRIFFENEVTIDDSGNNGEFRIGANMIANVLGSGRVVLENTTTFSVL